MAAKLYKGGSLTMSATMTRLKSGREQNMRRRCARKGVNPKPIQWQFLITAFWDTAAKPQH